MKKETEIKRFNTPFELFQFAAEDFYQRAIEKIATHGKFSVVLSGGETPKALFDVLAATPHYRNDIPWDKILFFFSDERYVPSDSSQSNYHMAHEHLFSKVSVNPENIYRIPTEFNDPNLAAKAYETIIRDALDLSIHGYPTFDLVYLGLGDDAHTASLMPENTVVKQLIEDESDQSLVAALYVEKLKMFRITLTPNTINQGLTILFLVAGENKSQAVKKVMEGELNPILYPAQLIHSIHGETIWYLDNAAATLL